VAALCVVSLAASHSSAADQQWSGWSQCQQQYLDAYVAGYKADLDVGRNLVDDGALRPDGSVEDISDARACAEADQLEAMLNPPAPAPVETEAAVTPSTDSGSYSIPSSIVECESGGDYGAVNPSSGAYGAYQILPSTSASYGCDMSTPAGQDACAAEIYADSGGSAWVC
jgi:hypothetical protein